MAKTFIAGIPSLFVGLFLSGHHIPSADTTSVFPDAEHPRRLGKPSEF